MRSPGAIRPDGSPRDFKWHYGSSHSRGNSPHCQQVWRDADCTPPVLWLKRRAPVAVAGRRQWISAMARPWRARTRCMRRPRSTRRGRLRGRPTARAFSSFEQLPHGTAITWTVPLWSQHRFSAQANGFHPKSRDVTGAPIHPTQGKMHWRNVVRRRRTITRQQRRNASAPNPRTIVGAWRRTSLVVMRPRIMGASDGLRALPSRPPRGQPHSSGNKWVGRAVAPVP